MRRPLFFVCLCIVVIAALRLWLYEVPREGDEQPSFPADGELVTVTGRVEQKNTQSFILEKIHLETSYAAASRQRIPMEEKLICEYNGDLAIGCTVTLQGIFTQFSGATNPGEFDAAEYYHTQKIGGKLTELSILAVSSDYSEWRELLYRIRCYFKERLYTVFPEKEASVLTAMLLGDKEDLDRNVKELYQQNGIIHILSISGLHITMIGMGIYRLLRKVGMPIWLSAVCGGGILLMYGMMTGMSLSACRAIGMYCIRMLGLVVGRSYDMLTALGVMAVILTWMNPENLKSAGFLLSFGSILGIGWFYPALRPEEKKTGPQRYESLAVMRRVKSLWKNVKEALIQSILSGCSITLFTLPIQLWFYYEVPVYSVLLNVLILPFMSAVVATGMFALLVPGSGIVGTITCLILSGYEWLCESFQKLPFHTWNPGKPKVWQVVVYYLLLLLCVLIKSNTSTKSLKLMKSSESKKFKKIMRFPELMQFKKIMRSLEPRKIKKIMKSSESRKIKKIMRFPELMQFKKIMRSLELMKSPKLMKMPKTRNGCFRGVNKDWGVAGIIFLAILIFAVPKARGTIITFLDVGQGECIVMEMASGEVYLFDCGSTGRKGVGEYVLLPFLKYKGIQRIDAVFVSHMDTDHCSGIMELLAFGGEENLVVEQIVLPNISGDMKETEMGALLEAVEAATQKTEIRVSYIRTGDTFTTESAGFLCLHPPKDYVTEDSNAYSQCFYVEVYGDKKPVFSLLLTGDVEGEGEELLLGELQKYGISDVTVLKVAHHGSKYSSTLEFLEQITPAVAVISCGESNSYGHPHEETLERLEAVGSKVLTTPEYGAITVDVRKALKVYGFTRRRMVND